MKSSRSVVSIVCRVARRILKRSNLGTDDKYHLPLAVHSIRAVQATTTSRTVTVETEWQIFFLSFGEVMTPKLWHLGTYGIRKLHNCWFSCYEILNVMRIFNLAKLLLTVYCTVFEMQPIEKDDLQFFFINTRKTANVATHLTAPNRTKNAL